MEQYQNTVVVQDVPREPAPIKLQGAALALGIISFVLSILCYFASIFTNVMRVAIYEHSGTSISGAIVIVFSAISLILGLIAVVLGAIGLVRSIRRETRTVKGIVFSAIALCLGIAALCFGFLSILVTGVFSAIIMYAH